MDTKYEYEVEALVNDTPYYCELRHEGGVWILSCPLVDTGDGWREPLRMALSLDEIDGMIFRKDDGAYLLKTALKIEGGCLKRV